MKSSRALDGPTSWSCYETHNLLSPNELYFLTERVSKLCFISRSKVLMNIDYIAAVHVTIADQSC